MAFTLDPLYTDPDFTCEPTLAGFLSQAGQIHVSNRVDETLTERAKKLFRNRVQKKQPPSPK